MGCANSKENTNPPTITPIINDNSQQLINDQFRKWLKSNRPKADEYVLNDVISTAKQSNDIDDYRTIVTKALDLLSEHHDIKSTQKLSKLVQKEVSLASPKKVAHTIDVLKQTAEKLHHGQIIFDSNPQPPTTTNGEITNATKTSENKHGQTSSGEPGIVLKEALEKARVLFYKGKQAAIFANPNGGYDVRIIDENDDVLNQDGNLLRSIIVTEVKMRPKPTTIISPQFTVPPPPPPTKLLDEHEIGDDFRRSIDAALKGLEAIYQTSPQTSSEHRQEVHINKISSPSTSKDNTVNLAESVHQEKVIINTNDKKQQPISQTDVEQKLVSAINNMNDEKLDTIETTTKSEVGNSIPSADYETINKLVTTASNDAIEQIVKEIREHEDKYQANESLPAEQSLSLQDEESIQSSSSQQNIKLNDEDRPKSFTTNEHNLNKQVSPNELSSPNSPTSRDTIINNEAPLSISQTIEEPNKIPSELSLLPVDIKSPSHNVTYTEIIHSESRDGEQSRRFITESYDENPLKDDEQTTTLKVVTKSEFSNHPSLGEKIMEQSVQVITVKVRNETIKTTNPLQTPENEISCEKSSVKNDANTIDTTI